MIIEGFGGPGGWDEGARMLGLNRMVGIEWDAAACRTRAAAGHLTIRADITQFPVQQLAGKVTGTVHSPECTQFSAAGSQAGNAIIALLAELIRDMFAGRQTRAKHRNAMAAALHAANWPPPKMRPTRFGRTAGAKKHKTPVRLTRAQQSAAIRKAVLSASLVAEPARFIHACRPEWVALEQVPSVLPLWKVYAAELRKMGYSAWCGKLNAADYSVPQTRERAILIASRVRRVSCPPPTHCDPGKIRQDDLFGSRLLPWVTMAEALGFGATQRVAPTVTAGGTAAGGAEPFARGGRDALQAAHRSNLAQWVLRREVGASLAPGRRDHPADEPAPTITGGGSAAGSGNGAGLRWVLNTNRGQEPDGTRQTVDPSTATALTAKSGGQWKVKSFRNNNNNNACERSLDEPAGTLFFGGRSNWAAWQVERDGETVVDGRSAPSWTAERPSTTVQGDPRVGRPGHKDRDKGESMFETDSVRITVQEAAVLQSFRPDYPWQGTQTKQFEQCGNAVPPLLAAHVLAEATGRPIPAVLREAS